MKSTVIYRGHSSEVGGDEEAKDSLRDLDEINTLRLTQVPG